MFQAFKNPLMLLFAMLIMVSMSVPHLCLDEHITSKTTISAELNHAKSSSDHGKSSKTADNCCVAHHCCVGKVLNSANIAAVFVANVTAMTFPPLDQVYSSVNTAGLERPPKSLA